MAAGAPIDERAIVIEDIVVGYGDEKPVISNLSFAFKGPGIVRVHGQNGSGKSTLLEAISGYLPLTRGRISILGHEPTSAARRGLRVHSRGSVSLFPEMTVDEHLYFACKFASSSLKFAHSLALNFGMSPWMETPAKELSTGLAKKLWLVMAFSRRWHVGLLDEPFAGLDEESIGSLIATAKRLGSHRTMLIVAHDWPEELGWQSRLLLAAEDVASGLISRQTEVV